MSTKSVILLRTESNVDRWVKSLAAALPEFEIVHVTETSKTVEQASVNYAVVWNPPVDFFVGLDRLKAIFSVGAGVDHLKNDLFLPPDVPVVRMVDDDLTTGMVEYVVFQVLRFHREFYRYEHLQEQVEWRVLPQKRPQDRRVGILGLGVLGEAVARQLASLQFDVNGWSRTEKNLAGIRCWSGPESLDPFLKETDILICLLPLTDSTRALIDVAVLDQLAKGACLINAARGEHLVESDLLKALNSGQLAAAALDVFVEEPLPDSNPLWKHPRVFITPHAAAQTGPESAALRIAEEVARIEKGKQPLNAVNMQRGY